MRVQQQGCLTKVTFSGRDVLAFKRRWPASGLPDTAITFWFDDKFDVVDARPLRKLELADVNAVNALTEDARDLIDY